MTRHQFVTRALMINKNFFLLAPNINFIYFRGFCIESISVAAILTLLNRYCESLTQFISCKFSLSDTKRNVQSYECRESISFAEG